MENTTRKLLTDRQMSFFEENGYLVVDDILGPDRVIAPIRREYAGIMDGLYDTWFADGLVTARPETLDFDGKLIEAYRAGCDWFQPMDISLPGDRIRDDTPMHFGPAVFDLLTAPRLLDLAEDLIGPEITSTPIQHVRIKPPATELHDDEIRAHVTSTDWHQDRGVAHAEADDTTMITVWCAITDATPENGCLQIIPGGHRDGMKPHCPKTQTAIADGFIDESAAIPLPVKSGGVVILHPLLPHASLINRTRALRWSFDLRYNRTGEPTGRAHFPEFVARSRASPENELRSWETWRDMWRTARADLSRAPHIDIHRWRLDSPLCA